MALDELPNIKGVYLIAEQLVNEKLNYLEERLMFAKNNEDVNQLNLSEKEIGDKVFERLNKHLSDMSQATQQEFEMQIENKLKSF